jgi:hypothetical protein
MAVAFRSLTVNHVGAEFIRVRGHAATVRALLDELERFVPAWRVTVHEVAPELREQLAEELARLGCRLLECAEQVTKGLPPQPPTGRGLTTVANVAGQASSGEARRGEPRRNG